MPLYIKTLLALIFILVIILLLSYLVKRFFIPLGKISTNMKLKEVLYIDPKIKMVLVELKDTSYVLLLGKNGETLIEKFKNNEK